MASFKNTIELPDSIDTDTNGIVAWNPAAEKITGIKGEAVVGRDFNVLEHIGVFKDDVQYIRKAVICREFSAAPASGRSQQSATPVAAETFTDDEKATNLKVALHAYERKIFLKAIRHCRTIRELAAHLHISPATALRKLNKHELSLIA